MSAVAARQALLARVVDNQPLPHPFLDCLRLFIAGEKLTPNEHMIMKKGLRREPDSISAECAQAIKVFFSLSPGYFLIQLFLATTARL
jgi:hypothetical protein